MLELQTLQTESLPISMRVLDSTSIGTILKIQDEAFEVLQDKDLLRRNTVDTLLPCFNDDSLVLGAYVDGTIAGIGILYAAGADHENLAYEIDDFREKERYANAKLIIVRPAFRGAGIQRRLLDEMTKFAAAKGFLGILATVSPKNDISIANLLHCGFVAIKTGLVKYGGKQRILFFKGIGINAA